jgi:hypothetical protein
LGSRVTGFGLRVKGLGFCNLSVLVAHELDESIISKFLRVKVPDKEAGEDRESLVRGEGVRGARESVSREGLGFRGSGLGS